MPIDICTGCTVVVQLVSPEQTFVGKWFRVPRWQFPTPIRGLGSDKDSPFINEMLLGYCLDQKLGFSRSRHNHKKKRYELNRKIDQSFGVLPVMRA